MAQESESAQAPLPQSLKDGLQRIVVKLHDSIEYAADAEAVELLTARMKNCFASQGQVPVVRSVFNPESRALVQKLMKRAKATDPNYRPRNLLNYFSVEIAPSLDLEERLKFLRSLPHVETAYLDLAGEDTQVVEAVPSFPCQQGYLGAAPDGIGVALVWPRADGTGVKGADGTGLKLIDMELGWTLDHVDLATHGTQPLFGRIVDGCRQHGTSVLGVIGAQGGLDGCVGIVPNLASIQVVSYAANGHVDYPNAIMAALENLQTGDVFLLEAQLARRTPLPLEVLPAVFDAIALATACGVIVIEPAGNNSGGGIDLDQYANISGAFVLNPAAEGFRDSGAIMVGAASSSSPHSRLSTSNFGTRVNCYAWGENVFTLNSNSSGETQSYRNDFRGTSAASAIIAGAALSVQGMAEQNLGHRLGPLEIRELLGDRTTGTLSAGDLAAGGTAVDLIGVMPDLTAISGIVLNVTGNWYFRQSLDNGSLPDQESRSEPAS